MQTAQSMHSSGSITSMFGPSWKQSTGHTSTQSVYLHLMQLSVTTWVIRAILEFGGAPEGEPRKSKIIRLSSRCLKARADGHWSFAYIRIEVAIESGSAGRGRELQPSRAGLCSVLEGRRDQGGKSQQVLRVETRGRRRLLRTRHRRGAGVPRAQRRGQVDHHAHDHRFHSPERGRGLGVRAGRAGKSDRGEAPDRLSSGSGALVYRDVGPVVPQVRRRDARPAGRGTAQRDTPRRRTVPSGERARADDRYAFEGLPPPHLPRAGADPRSRGADPG